MNRFFLLQRILTQCTAVVICALAPCLADSDFGRSSWLRGGDDDFARSRSRQTPLHQLAEEARDGDVVAMRELGLISMKGKKVKKSANIAIQWWRKAANRGDALSMMYLGDVYRTGSGVRKNLQQALSHYDECFRTMQNEDDEIRCEDSHPVIQRIKKLPLEITIHWWEKRCQKDDTHALYYLGSLSPKKRKGVIDDATASAFLIKAAQMGNQKAKAKIESSPRAQYLAYWESRIKKGNANDAYSMAEALYNNGNCTEQEKAKSMEYYTMAAASGNKKAEDWLVANKPGYASLKLLEAARHGNVHEFDNYIQAGADPNFQSQNGETPLLTSISRKQINSIKKLLALPGIDVNKMVSDYTPIMMAAKMGYTEAVKLLLAAPGIHLNIKAPNGLSALALALENNHQECVKLIHAAGGKL